MSQHLLTECGQVTAAAGWLHEGMNLLDDQLHGVSPCLDSLYTPGSHAQRGGMTHPPAFGQCVQVLQAAAPFNCIMCMLGSRRGGASWGQLIIQALHPACILDWVVALVDQASVSAGDSEAAAEGVQHLRARPLLSSNPLLDAVHVPGTYVMSSMASH